MVLKILDTPTFRRVVKKLHAQEKKALDQAVQAIAADPSLGEAKKGDLAGGLVYKFKMTQQESRLAYRLQPSRSNPVELVLLNLGSHENFYADLKRQPGV